MEGRCTHSPPVFANLCWPAVYNLNTVRVLAAVCGGGSGYHVQRWHRTSHMTVVYSSRRWAGQDRAGMILSSHSLD